MSLPGGATGFTLSFGPYGDPSFVGLKGILRLSNRLEHLATGAVVQQSWTVTIGGDGTATLTDLPYNDDPAFSPVGSSYRMEWQALSWKDTPGNRTFQVLRAAGATVDFDTLPDGSTPPPVPTGYVTQGALDAAVAALLASPTSATRTAALGLPTYPGA